MAYEISWYQETRIILVCIRGEIPVEEGIEISERIADYIEAGSPQVHLLLDFAGLTRVPLSLPQLQSTVQAYARNPKLGWLITCGIKSQIIRFLAATVSQAFNIRYQTFDTVEAGVAFLKDADITLSPTSLDYPTAT